MEHPLIASLDDQTAEQLLEKINELNRKLGIAFNTGNAHLCNQIRMAIESYQTKYNEKVRSSKGTGFDEVIDIS
jgi:ABC-type phosphate/phosphonate transport system ATPase subunit